jgi:cAMP phosphodiesterase
MKLEVLGCAGGEGIGRRATSFLINDCLLIDAGSVVTSLTLERQTKISHALITHAHLDHIKDLGFIADNTFEIRSSPLQIIADVSVIEALRTHYFNWVIWPDFSKLPSPEAAVVDFVPCEKSIQLDRLNIEFIEVNHPGGGYGFLIEEPSSDCSILISGDTGDTSHIWQRAQTCKNLKAIFADTAFPDDKQELARLSGHMTPAQLLKKLTEYQLAHHQIYCYHLKPAYHERVLADIETLNAATFRPLLEGETIDF